MTSENTPSQTDQPAEKFTPAPSFTGRSQGVSPRAQTAERLDSLKNTAAGAGQKLNDLRSNPRVGRDAVESTARKAWDTSRGWGEKGLRTLSSGALKAADFLKSLDKDGKTASAGQHALPPNGAPSSNDTGNTSRL